MHMKNRLAAIDIVNVNSTQLTRRLAEVMTSYVDKQVAPDLPAVI